MTIRILIADDHQIFREGLRLLLSAQPHFEIIAEASNGSQALQLAEEHQPDLMILDLMMPGLNGLEVTRILQQRLPNCRSIILSMHNDENYVLKALRYGAKAYVLKEFSVDELVCAVRSVMKGYHYLSAPLAERAIEIYANRNEHQEAEDLYETLTNREREVFHWVIAGHSSAEIAGLLAISPRTVETHRVNIYRKLNLHNAEDLQAFMQSHQLI